MWSLGGSSDDPALIVGNRIVTYEALKRSVEETSEALPKTPGLVLIRAEWSFETVVWHLACLETSTPVLLVDPSLNSERVQQIAEEYEAIRVVNYQVDEFPGYRFEPHDATWHRIRLTGHSTGAVHLIILTSGSTGEPKGVAVTTTALRANIDAIIDRLGIDQNSRGITSLPFQYSFGLSVLHSHLAAGSSIVLTQLRPPTRRFYQLLDECSVTHLAGVSFTFEVLRKQLVKHWPAELRQLAHSGSPMAISLQHELVETAAAHNAEFFAMYGRSELMTRVTAANLVNHREKIGSVGYALSGVSLRSTKGEITVRSPSAMLGYVTSAADLASFEEKNAVEKFHPTGDLGEIDQDGFVWIRGRVSRLCKPLGRRVSLDEVERYLREEFGICALAVGVDERILLGIFDDAEPATVVSILSRTLSLPSSSISALRLAEVPRTSGGKIDYTAAKQLLVDATRPGGNASAVN